MPNSPRMRWPYPSQDQDPWFEQFETMVQEMDSSGAASREDRQTVMGEGGDVSFDASAGLLSWSAALEIYAPIKGVKSSLAAQGVNIAHGEALYVELTRYPTDNQTLTAVVSSQVPSRDEAFVICVRNNDTIYFRHGVSLEDGDTKQIFNVAGGAVSEIYERQATFTVPEGSGAQSATEGVAVVAGSMIGLSAELLRPVTSGTVTVNAKIGGVTAFTVTLSFPANPEWAVSTTAAGPVGLTAGAPITVEVQTTTYLNADSLASGLTVNVAMKTTTATSPTEIPDASTTVKGVTKLSVAPVSAANPIAVGDNDPRLGGGTLQAAYDGGNTIVTAAATPVVLDHDVVTASPALEITCEPAASSTGPTIDVLQGGNTDGSSYGIRVRNQGVGYGADLTVENAGGYGLHVANSLAVTTPLISALDNYASSGRVVDVTTGPLQVRTVTTPTIWDLVTGFSSARMAEATPSSATSRDRPPTVRSTLGRTTTPEPPP